MWLPTPLPEAVLEFKELYKQQTGEDLTDTDALDVSTRLLHLYYLKNYVFPSFQERKQGDQKVGSPPAAVSQRKKKGASEKKPASPLRMPSGSDLSPEAAEMRKRIRLSRIRRSRPS